MFHFDSIIACLEHWASVKPNSQAFIFLHEPDFHEESMTYQELYQHVRYISAQLRQKNVLPGDRVILVYQPGLEYICAFMACLYTGALAVPLYPPLTSGLADKFLKVLENSEAHILLTDKSIYQKIKQLKLLRIANRLPFVKSLSKKIAAEGTELSNLNLDKLNWLITDRMSQESIEEFKPHIIRSDSLAFLQYTSGSTGNPKGVMVSHGNIISNQKLLAQGMQSVQESISVHWLPPYHDMGLIGAIMQPLYSGFLSILMSPLSFIRQPEIWLKSVSKYKATITSSPNFGYALCLKVFDNEKKLQLDLSSLDIAINGAEPIQPDILDRFYKQFKECGFKRSVFCPAYGLAEATLAVSLVAKNEEFKYVHVHPKKLSNDQFVVITDEKKSQKLTSCGSCSTGVKIVNPNTLELISGNELGEIWLQGDCITLGYWRLEEETQNTFKAQIKNGDGTFYLRTGDLGFIYNNELYVTGRIKDLIIIDGLNYYPQDIELTAIQSHQSIRLGNVIALGISGDAGEQLAVVAEVKERLNEDELLNIVTSIKTRVAEIHQLPVHIIALLPKGSLPKTTSGKVERRKCKEMLLKGKLKNLLVWQSQVSKKIIHLDYSLVTQLQEHCEPRNDLEIELATIWSDLLVIKQISIYDNFFEIGGNSLIAAQLALRVRTDLCIELPLSDIFEHQTIAQLAESLRVKKKVKLENNTIQPDLINRNKPFPLNAIQEAYWLGRSNYFDLGGVSCHFYIEIDSTHLDLDKYQQAWNKLIQRHEMLRSVIIHTGEQQILSTVPEYRIKATDLRLETIENKTKNLAQLHDSLSHEVLAIDQWPLFSIHASLLDENITRLHISYDLLIGDAWSLSLLLGELEQYYRNEACELPPLGISFRDYVLAEQDLRHSETYYQSRAYWQDRCKYLPSSPQLPINTERLVAAPHFQRREGRLSSDKWHQLKQYAAEAKVTPSVLLTTLFAKILANWSTNTHFTLNLTEFRRIPFHTDVMKLVGDFTSLTLLEVNLSSNQTIREEAQNIQKQLWQDLDHALVSGIEVLKMLRQERADPTIIMPVVITSAIGMDFGANNSFGDIVYAVSQTPQVWLDHQIREQEGELIYSWDAVEDLFLPGVLDDMFLAYEHLLQFVIKIECLNEASVHLTPQKTMDLYAKTNSTQSMASTQLLFELFVEQAHKNPSHLAVISGDKALTYEELDILSNKVSHYLEQLNPHQSKLIGVVCEKGWEQIVSVLAIQKMGSAYLPVNPSDPKQRIVELLQDAQVSIILTQSFLIDKLDFPKDIFCICIDSDVYHHESSHPMTIKTTSEDLAYVIYTSGSTGKPKGVMINHGSAVNTVLDINRRFNVTSSDTILALSSLTFDLSVYDLFGTLAAGATLVLPDANKTRDPQHWLKLISTHHISLWNSVPMSFLMLLEYVHGAKQYLPESLRLCLVSGDWVPVDIGHKLLAVSKHPIEIVSLGGATEASIWSIYYPFKATEVFSKRVPYGKPLTNQQFYVFNQNLEPCPIWVCGQLYIGGLGLAQGYWNDIEKTEKKFITHPRTGERLYDTGDLGRYVPSGDIEFLGRIDSQIKIRGHRVECGEIEYVLEKNALVSKAKVLLHPETKELISFIIPKNHQLIETITESLNEAINKNLPDYIRIAQFHLLDQLPLTFNGKIDTKALILEHGTQTKISKSVEVKVDSSAELLKLIELTQNILPEKTNIDSQLSLQELGLDSLKLVQLYLAIKNEFHIEFEFSDLFKQGSLGKLTLYIQNILRSGPKSQIGCCVLSQKLTHELNEAVTADAFHIEAKISSSTPVKSILITGATGFLGREILSDLLRIDPSSMIYLLVRAKTPEDAWIKVSNVMDATLLEQNQSRLNVVLGSIEDEYFGLNKAEYDLLEKNIEAVVHVAARVDYVSDYSWLHAANVIGTNHILDFCSNQTLKRLHYVSSSIIFPIANTFMSDEVLDNNYPLYGGYAQTKWVAEKKVRLAATHGMPVGIYRPSILIGNTDTGECNVNDLFFRALKSSIQLGCAPDLPYQIDGVPVNVCSQLIAHSVYKKEVNCRLNIINDQPPSFSDLISWVNDLGYPVELVSYDAWRKKLMCQIEVDTVKNPLYPLLSFFPENINNNPYLSMTNQLDLNGTKQSLVEYGLQSQVFSSEIMDKFLSYLTEINFIEKKS